MSDKVRAIFFDVDGVLIDSLGQHLAFCRDEATALRLQINVPNAAAFRQMVLAGTRISPMQEFFRAVGFPNSRIAEAVQHYDEKFATTHRPAPFAGVEPTLRSLRDAGIRLGLVTSNIPANVAPILGAAIDLFEPTCRFYLEPGQTKANQITRGIVELDVAPDQSVFVGDQPADLTAAQAAGAKFVGVTYGWGYDAGAGLPFETAATVYEIPLAAQRAVLHGKATQQRDYAWNWFNYHANQRVEMFNYMFVGLGLFATAIAATLDKHLPDLVLATLCFLAGIVAFIFFLIDGRNGHLVELAEDVLTEIERTSMFGRGNTITSRSGETIPYGILWRQHLQDQEHVGFWRSALQGRHRIWLRAIAIILGVLFLVSGALIAEYGLPDQDAKKQSLLLKGPG
jgi:phosphoglycolate phosphatase-like HAD superfamily hydrolase